MGTVIDQNAAKRIKKRIDLALASGAKLLFGGEKRDSLLSPPILDNVYLSMAKGSQ